MTLVDLRHFSRSIRRSPASAGAAVLTLSLTLGVGASIFAVVDAVLLTPPPFTDPDALVLVGEVPIAEPMAASRAVSYATFEAWRERAGSLASLEAFDGTNLTLTELGVPERLSATDVTPRFLTLLGVTPMLGRLFDDDDVGRPVAIISNAFWRGKLAADADVIGRQLVLGGRPHIIVGVLTERFFFGLNRSDLWRPLPVTPAQATRSGYLVGVVARLAPNVLPAHLTTALDDASRTSSQPMRVIATTIATAMTGDSARTLGLLAGAAALAVLIAFTNLAGLLIVRSIDRRRELAVRRAVGASHSEIAAQLLLDAVALVAIGTLGGVLLALWATPVAGRLALEQFRNLANGDVAMSWRVIGSVIVVAFVLAFICGLLSALGAARWRLVDVLRGRATWSTHELALRRVFVAGEIALAFVLLVSMALLGRTLVSVLGVNPGFEAQGVLTLQLSLPTATYTSNERVASFYSGLLGALQGRLGTGAVSFIDEIPLTGDRGRRVVSVSPADVGSEAVVRAASPGYFAVMRIPVLAGRSFDAEDDATAPTRVVVSRSLAQTLFGFERPIGRQIRLGANAQLSEIIGVVGEVTHRALDETPLPTVYVSAWQAPSPSSIIVVRSTRPYADVIGAVREEVGRLDAYLPVYNVRPMQDVVAVSPGVPVRRLLTAAFTGFGLLAVVLSMIGVFGVVAHDVACCRRELALRMALGAAPMRIMTRTFWQAGLMLGPGLAVGGLLSIWAAPALDRVVSTTGQSSALNIGLAAALLIAAGASAALPVARRAARTDPLTVLRGE